MNKRYRVLLAPVVFLISFFVVIQVNAAGQVDTTFKTFLAENNGLIEESVIQPDGKIIVQGNFETLNDQVETFFSRLNADGTLDSTFNAPEITKISNSGPVKDIVIQSDGKIIIAGNFTYQGQTRGLIRLNPDGSPDTVFNNLPYILTFISSNGLAIYPNDMILVSHSNNLILLNPDGMLNFYTTQTIMPGKLFLQNNGKIVILSGEGGHFIYRANADLTRDNSFPATDAFLSADLQPDGKVVVGGAFVTINGFTVRKVARL